jgi:membrane-bound inhibitor of C-type lysozyme
MTRRLAAVAIAALTGVAACQQSEPEQPPVPVQAPAVDPATAPPPAVGYACESGATIQARYPDTATAELVYRGQTLALRSVEAASGARYIGSGVEWWTANRDGEESATLSRLGTDNQTGAAVMERCTRPTVGSTPTGPLPTPTPAPGGLLPAAAPCKGPQLKLSVEGGDAGAGNRVRNFALQNAGTQTCTLTGYPTVTVQDDDGDVLTDVRAEQSPGSYFRQGQAPTPVTLVPQAKALFEVAWTVVPNEAQGQKTCPTAAEIRVIAPADTAVITAPFEFSPCGNRIRVSPLRAAD